MTHVATLIMLLLVVIGAAFMVIAAIGILRMPDLYTRLHVASKAPALGLAALALALAFHLQDVGLWFRAAALGLLLFVTAPVSTILIARAGHRAGAPLSHAAIEDDIEEFEREEARTT